MPSRIIKRGKVRWLGRVQKNHKIRQKLFTTKAEALAWETEQRQADWTTDTVSLTLLDWANRYLDYCKARFAEKTYLEKRLAFAKLLQSLPPEMSIEALEPIHFLDHLQAQALERSGNAANKDRKNLHAAWEWGVRYLDLPRLNPLAETEKFPEVRQLRYVPPEEDFWKVFDLAEGQDRVMLGVFLYLAARRGEVFRLRWDEVDFDRRLVGLATRKRKSGSLEYDWLPMAHELAELLSWWREHRSFPQASHVFICEEPYQYCREYYGRPFRCRVHFMARMCERAGVKRFTFHAIRHLSASILFKRGYPVSVIQAILRHKSPNVTERYLQSLGLEDTRPALESLGRGKVIPITKKRSSKVAALEDPIPAGRQTVSNDRFRPDRVTDSCR